MRVLLLGASGFAGRHFATAAREAGLDLVAAARRGSAEADLTCDLLEPSSLEAALRESQPDAIVNLAGAASVAASLRDPAPAYEANAVGALNLLEAATRHTPDAHLLCVSSGEVYGPADPADLPLTERSPLKPASPYGASKLAMELLCEQYARVAGLRIAIVRAFNHTGPGQSDAFAASSFARQVAAAEREGLTKLRLRTGDLALERDFSDVRDIVAAYLALIQAAETGTFNACSGTPTRIGELIDLLAGCSDVRIETEVDPALLRDGEPRALFGSAERLSSTTGWRPRVPLATTVSDLLEWWRERMGR